MNNNASTITLYGICAYKVRKIAKILQHNFGKIARVFRGHTKNENRITRVITTCNKQCFVTVSIQATVHGLGERIVSAQ